MRAVLVFALMVSCAACNDQRARVPAVATNPFAWSTTPDGRLQPPDGPCERNTDCVLRTDCGCGCFAVRQDFTDSEHRCLACAAQVSFCLGATAQCEPTTHRCTVAR